MDIPSSLTPISEEENRSREDAHTLRYTEENPFLFPSNGDNGSPPISMVITPAAKPAEIIVTDVEGSEFDEQGETSQEITSGEQAFESCMQR